MLKHETGGFSAASKATRPYGIRVVQSTYVETVGVDRPDRPATTPSVSKSAGGHGKRAGQGDPPLQCWCVIFPAHKKGSDTRKQGVWAGA